MPNGNGDEREITEVLLSFVDFLYAVVFGLILAETYQEVIDAEKGAIEIASNLLLIAGVFYFLSWDWLHARLLTHKNPYRSYRRFFLEIIIAFCGYGAALRAIEMKISLLFYLTLVLLLGSVWARRTLREHPRSNDRAELVMIQRLQVSVSAMLVALLFLFWDFNWSVPIKTWQTLSFILLGWEFVLVYEMFIPRPPGIQSGPGVPFLNRGQIGKMRKWVIKLLHRIKKGVTDRE